MENGFLQTVVEQMPTAYAYHKIIVGEDGAAEDYVFLDLNRAFEDMTGLKRGDVINRRVTEVIPDIRKDSFDWIGVYGAVAASGVPKEFTKFSESLGRWYRVNVFSPAAGCFATIFYDVTEEYQNMARLERQAEEISRLHRNINMIFNSTYDAMFLLSYEGGEFRYVSTNRSHQILTGLSDEKLQGKTPAEVFEPSLGKWFLSRYRECVEKGDVITYEQTLKLPGGTRTWMTSLTPVYEDGKICYLTGSMQDITEFQKTVEEKNELLRRLQAMFDGHRAAMLLVERDTGHIRDANPAACAFFEHSKEELLSMSAQEADSIPAAGYKDGMMKAFREGKGYFLAKHHRKNGDIRMMDIYASPILYGNEKLLYFIITDATARERYRQELFRKKELLNVTLTSIGDAVVTTDRSGCITLLNSMAQRLTGWSEAEAKNRHFSEVFRLYNEQTDEEVVNPVEKVLRSGAVVGLANHTVLLSKQGIRVPIADSAAPIRDSSGETFGVVMVFRDVSQEKEHQKRVYYLSYHDQLTGLYNRRYMEHVLEEFNVPERMPMAMIMGDVNGLKITNDVFGHQVGDKLLQKVAYVMGKRTGGGGCAARWGGDEFIILLPNTGEDSAEAAVEQIKQACREESNETLHVSVSLGFAIQNQISEKQRNILQQAENMMYHQKLLESKSYRNTIINTLLSTMYEKSMETEEHAMRLKQWCTKMARKLNMSSAEINDLELFAMLHDIGKVGIPQNILQKPGPLTQEEWEQMRKHSEIGYRIAQNTPELSAVAEYILYHHERWDGEGYPSRLSGTEIPLQCRILAIADAYDAMTNDRVYRRAMTKQQAIEEIQHNRGTQFDPAVVDLFLDIIEDEQTSAVTG